jgi:hypothetical protein
VKREGGPVGIVTFRGLGALPVDYILKGLTVGAALMIGSFITKPFLLRLAAETFRSIMDALRLASEVNCCGMPRPDRGS